MKKEERAIDRNEANEACVEVQIQSKREKGLSSKVLAK